MRQTLACLLFFVICMTVSARYPYEKANKDKKYYGYGGWSSFRNIRWGRWGQKRAFDARKDKPEEVWAEMFKALDEDDDERVDIDELRDDMATVLKGETRTPEDLMAETDANGDGYIDFDEFLNDIGSDNPHKRMCRPPFSCGK